VRQAAVDGTTTDMAVGVEVVEVEPQWTELTGI